MPRSRQHPKPPDKATRRRMAEQVLRDSLPHMQSALHQEVALAYVFAVLDGHLIYHPEQQAYELTATGVRVLKTFAIQQATAQARCAVKH